MKFQPSNIPLLILGIMGLFLSIRGIIRDVKDIRKNRAFNREEARRDREWEARCNETACKSMYQGDPLEVPNRRP
jgi:hypothetical protein